MVIVAGCDVRPAGVPGQVDVINRADRPLLITITSANGGSAWRLDPGEAAVVLRGARSVAGTVELIDPSDCATADSAQLGGSSTTIVIEQLSDGADPDVELRLEPGATGIGPLSTDFFGGCSG